MHHLLSALAFVSALINPPARPADLRGEALMAALKKGGYTIVLRHARTDRSFQEAMGAIPPSRALQRNLNDDGVKDARLMGVVFKKYGIPFGEVISSPMYRCTETAEYATGGAPKTDMLLRQFPTSDEQLKLLAVAPKAGTNRLLVTHHFVIETFVPSINVGDIGESEAAVVRPLGNGKIELVGKIKLPDWTELAGDAAKLTADAPSLAVHQAPHGGAGAGYGSNDRAKIPNSLGLLAHGYAMAFNSGDTALMRKFIDQSFVKDPARSTDARVASYLKIFDEVGVLNLNGITDVKEHELTVQAKAKPGDVSIVLKESESQAGKAESVTFKYNRTLGGHP